MTELFQHRQRDRRTVPVVFANVFAGGAENSPTVTLCHGPYSEELPVAGMTVAEIRARFGDRLDIDPQSQAIVDGHEVDESTVVGAGQLLTFVRKAGEKGL